MDNDNKQNKIITFFKSATTSPKNFAKVFFAVVAILYVGLQLIQGLKLVFGGEEYRDEVYQKFQSAAEDVNYEE